MAGEVVVIKTSEETDSTVEALEQQVENIADDVEQIEEQVTEAVISAEVAEEKSEDALQWLARLSQELGQISTILTDKLEGLNNRLAKVEAELTPQPLSETEAVEVMPETVMPTDMLETPPETSSETKTEAPSESEAENPVAEAVEQLQRAPRQIIKL